MTHKDDTRQAWAIWLPWTGITYSGTFTHRNAAIRDFVIRLEADAYEEQEATGSAFINIPSAALTPTQSRAWNRWKARGAMAVHVKVTVADFRVRGARGKEPNT